MRGHKRQGRIRHRRRERGESAEALRTACARRDARVALADLGPGRRLEGRGKGESAAGRGSALRST